MSRIVLLEFADNAEAEDFARDVDTHWTGPEFNARVVAVVGKPTVWCKCDVPVESKGQRRRRQAKREGSWMRGGTLGWWCCAHCRKPSHAMVTHFVTTMLAGCNDLLPKIIGSGDPVTPSKRWELEGGIPNEHANAEPAMPYATTAKTRRRKRRSELDREASVHSS